MCLCIHIDFVGNLVSFVRQEIELDKQEDHDLLSLQLHSHWQMPSSVIFRGCHVMSSHAGLEFNLFGLQMKEM